MKPSYRLAWAGMLGVVGIVATWVGGGEAYVRRTRFPAPTATELSRTSDQFVAVLLPRITPEAGRYSMSTSDLRHILASLKTEGYSFLGVSDVLDFYAMGRKLPPKALFLAFDEESPRSIDLADGVLRELRLRATAFVSRTSGAADMNQRRYLTDHAIAQMTGGGSWTIGMSAEGESAPIPAVGRRFAVLGSGTKTTRTSSALRFLPAEFGLNGLDDDPHKLRILALRPERLPADNLSIMRNSWPRTATFSDEFTAAGLRNDWISGWGIVSIGGGRLALLPTPRQTGAGVILRGTEGWRDQTLEFELRKYRKEFWAYARYQDDGPFLRIGAHGGYWYVEQKTGPLSPPRLLARAPILSDGLPARVRVVLKGQTAIVQINGRLQFGRPLRLDPAVDRGRVLFGVHDVGSRSALAVLTAVHAAPLGEVWIAPSRGPRREFDETGLVGMRAESVAARAYSPRWVAIGSDGAVTIDETQSVLVRSLAGFYGCRLLPMAEFPPFGVFVLREPAHAAKALAGLIEAARRLDAAGLNLRLRAADVDRPETVAFLTALHGDLRARREELWVTVDGRADAVVALAGSVDGVLLPAARSRPDFEVLKSRGRFQ